MVQRTAYNVPSGKEEFDCGNVVSLLATLSSASETEIEQKIQSGTPTMVLAEELGVSDAFRSVVMNNVVFQLGNLVRSGGITPKEAEERMVGFQQNFKEVRKES